MPRAVQQPPTRWSARPLHAAARVLVDPALFTSPPITATMFEVRCGKAFTRIG
jgi:hypothetical protein